MVKPRAYASHNARADAVRWAAQLGQQLGQGFRGRGAERQDQAEREQAEADKADGKQGGKQLQLPAFVAGQPVDTGWIFQEQLRQAKGRAFIRSGTGNALPVLQRYGRLHGGPLADGRGMVGQHKYPPFRGQCYCPSSRPAACWMLEKSNNSNA